MKEEIQFKVRYRQGDIPNERSFDTRAEAHERAARLIESGFKVDGVFKITTKEVRLRMRDGKNRQSAEAFWNLRPTNL